jgi:KTSC domain
MPKRVAPKAYEVGPFFFGADYETTEYADEAALPQPRNELGQFTLRGTQVKDPSATINPPRPRSQRVSYSPRERTLRIQFREGRVYGYYDVPMEVWRSLRAVASTGRFINRRLDAFFEYGEEWPVDI